MNICLRCQFEFSPSSMKPDYKCCPRCKSPYWKTPYLKETDDGEERLERYAEFNRLRKKKHLTTMGIALCMDKSPATISNYRTGRTFIPDDVMVFMRDVPPQARKAETPTKEPFRTQADLYREFMKLYRMNSDGPAFPAKNFARKYGCRDLEEGIAKITMVINRQTPVTQELLDNIRGKMDIEPGKY